MTAPELDQPITYSRGRNTFDNCPEPCSADSFSEFCDTVLSDCAEKKGEQYIAAAFTSGSHPKDPDKYPGEKGWRSAKYAQSRRWFAMDVDGCSSPEAFHDLKQACSKYSCFGYTTASHTPDSPRARLIFELTRPVNRDEGLELGLALEHGFDNNPSGHKFNFDKSVYKSEQPIYLPLHDAEAFSSNGAPIDPDQWSNLEFQLSSHDSNGSKADWLEQLLNGKSVHDSTRAISMSMIRAGVNRRIVVATLRALLKETAQHRDAKRIVRMLDGSELDDLVNGAIEKVAIDGRPSFNKVIKRARSLGSFDGDDTKLAEAVELIVADAAFFSQVRKDLIYMEIKKNTPFTLGALRTLEQANREEREPEPDDGTLAKQLVAEVGEENTLAAESYVWLWEDTGIWRSLAQREVKQWVQRFISDKIKSVTKYRVDSVTDLFTSEVFRPKHQFNVGPPECVNVFNGELVLEANEWQLLPHELEHYRTTQIPVNWDPDAEAPRFTQFLQEVFNGDPDADDKAWSLLEMIGYTLMTHCRYELFIMLVGNGANGKSVLLDVLERLCGSDNVVGVQPSEFRNSFKRAHLHGKLANIVSELPEGKLIDDEALKSITSGELTTVDRKYKEPFEMRPFATCWFGTNHLPHTRDFSDALFRRALVMPFNRRFKPELGNCDPMLKEKLVDELPGILRMALNAYKRALVRGFTMPASCVKAAEEWRREADQVAQFIEDCCVVDPNGSEPALPLFGVYGIWADRCGIRNKVGIKQFRDRLTRLGFGDKRIAAGKLVTGLKLTREEEQRVRPAVNV